MLSTIGDRTISTPASPVQLPAELILHTLGFISLDYANYSCVRSPQGHRLGDFIRDRAGFARLRLISSMWDYPVLELLLETTVIMINVSREVFERNLKVFKYHAPLIHTLLIEEAGPSHIYTLRPVSQGAKRIADIIGYGLSGCFNLRNLDLGSAHFAFRNRRWLQTYCPDLPSTVTSLKLTSPELTRLSLALTALGRNLTDLELSSFIWDTRFTPIFHLPSEMQCLTRLVLRTNWIDEDTVYNFLRKLFSRIVINKRLPSAKTTPLRDLTLSSQLLPPRISELLSINGIGTRLTSFRFEASVPIVSSYGFFEDIPLMDKCPSPSAFSLISPYHPDIFQQLPDAMTPAFRLRSSLSSDSYSNHIIIRRNQPRSPYECLALHPDPREYPCDFCLDTDPVAADDSDAAVKDWIAACESHLRVKIALRRFKERFWPL
ncbi:hypothetical protein BD779DRAFT_1672528 [Infundibulicybe gibba]|nr:hypothetical protein BD779DRAFT_1672528 [Infundibulicybe gibba]